MGAARAGFHLAGAVELDKRAIETHKINFPNTPHIARDVAALSGKFLLEETGVHHGHLAGLIGGPPCQGFSHMGLRADADPRNDLLVHFFRLVDETKPAFFLAENVPGLLDSRNEKVRARALGNIPNHYKVLDPITIKACDYGAPTIRTRVFFFGYDPNRVSNLTVDSFRPKFQLDVRVRHALQCLPRIRATWQDEADSWRAVGTLEETYFSKRLLDHVPNGVGDPIALERLRQRREVSGFLGTAHTDETVRRFRAVPPGKSDAISKCPRLDPDGYCPTLRAGTGPERGSYQSIRPIHPSSPRVISPREGARLQGFPDWFQFHPTKWHAFRQIGNSVSPIVAESFLRDVRMAMK